LSLADRDPGRVVVLVDAHDPTFGRYWVDDANTMLIKQRIELVGQRAEAAGLHLDEFAICTNEVGSRSGRPAFPIGHPAAPRPP
jgi:hypothetical protein